MGYIRTRCKRISIQHWVSMLNHLIKFCPKKVEISEATVDDTICFGMHLKRLEPEIAEAMDIYKALSDDTYYRPEEQSADPPQQEDQ